MLGAEADGFQVLEMWQYASLGAGTCLSLINHDLFSVRTSGAADVFGAYGWPHSLLAPASNGGAHYSSPWVSARAVLVRPPPGTSVLHGTGLCPPGGGGASEARPGWRSAVSVSLLRLLGVGI